MPTAAVPNLLLALTHAALPVLFAVCLTAVCQLFAACLSGTTGHSILHASKTASLYVLLFA